MRRAPHRTCVGCRRTRPKTELLRLARTPTGVALDLTQTSPGRGAYVCPTVACVQAAARRDGGAVARALRAGPRDEVRAALIAATAYLDAHPDGAAPSGERTTRSTTRE